MPFDCTQGATTAQRLGGEPHARQLSDAGDLHLRRDNGGKEESFPIGKKQGVHAIFTGRCMF